MYFENEAYLVILEIKPLIQAVLVQKYKEQRQALLCERTSNTLKI